MNLKPLFAIPLALVPALAISTPTSPPVSFSYAPDLSLPAPLAGATIDSPAYIYVRDFLSTDLRSEERRVGKEGRSRGAPDH